MLDIVKLTPDRLDQYLDFFDRRAFADNPDWAFCYCNCFYADHCEKRWTDRTAEENRAAVAQRIIDNRMHGYLALHPQGPVGHEAVGWCGAGPMDLIPVFAEDDDPEKAQIGVITCFVVAPDWRRKGVARALIRFACRDFVRLGLSLAEANPRPAASTDAERHFGPLSLYLSEGFEHVRDDPEDGSVYVRKALSR